MRLIELIKEVEARIAEEASPDGFWRYMPSFFEEVISAGLYKTALNDILISIRDRSAPITAQHTAGQFIALHSTPWSNWSLIYHRDPASFLYLSPTDALQARVGGSDLLVGRFTCAQPASFEMLQPQLTLEDHGVREARLGTVFTRKGRHEILDWRAKSGAARPGVTLRVNSGPLADFEWAFDRSTLKPVGLTPIDPVESNLSTIFSLLSAVGDAGSVEHLEPFLTSKRHFVRWNAAQAIAALDVDACASALSRLADDPHPEVRAAARSSLQRLAAAAA